MNLDELTETECKWGIVFLKSDQRIDSEQREKLVRIAVCMFYEGRDELRIKTDDFEGVIYNTGKHESLGDSRGQRFDIELETNYGKVNLRFLVDDRTVTGYTPWDVGN